MRKGKKMNRFTKFLLLASGLLIAVSSQAELYRTGPSDLESPPGHGYPVWYQDTNGLALDLCVPQTLNQLDPCLATPLPGDPLPVLPYTFPDNWSDEFFWFGAEALLDMGNGETALLVQAVEAAFALGPPSIGDQIAFARIRIRFVVPVDGTYTVTFPYGRESFPNQVAGDRLFYTSDVGIGAPGDFSGALGGAIGPFLWAVDGAGNAKPYVDIDGDTFLADPVAETQVDGSPYDTNFFQVCVDSDPGIAAWAAGLDGGGLPQWCVTTDGFVLIGKVHDQVADPIASPLTGARATYSTHMLMPEAHVDIFASAEAGPGELPPILTAGIDGAASVLMDGPRDPGGLFYGQGIVGADAIPSQVTVINSADTPPSSIQINLVDAITITDATYNATTRTLTISAVSSDMLGGPTLSTKSVPGVDATGSDVLVNGSLERILLEGTVPPRTVTITSAAGGSETATVTMPEHGVAYGPGAPLAKDDFVSTGEDAILAARFEVLLNDGAEADGGSLAILAGSGPSNGIADTALNDGTVSYRPNAGYFGADSFKYTVSNAAGLSSNVATVTIDVVQINDAPEANDVIVAAPGLITEITVNVLANDTDKDGIYPAPGGLDPSTVTITSYTGVGAVANPDGTVTYTKNAACELAANCGFTYTVSDLGGLTSNVATVTVETAGSLAPIANADAASTLHDVMVNIDVAGNDSNVDGLLDYGSVVISATTPPANGTAVEQPNGSVNYTPNAGYTGTDIFNYTIANMLGERSGEASVTVTVNPDPDTLGVQRAQCRTHKGTPQWRVDGTSSILALHTVTIYAGESVGVEGNRPRVIAIATVDNLGSWRVTKRTTSEDCANSISIESSEGGRLEGVVVGN